MLTAFIFFVALLLTISVSSTIVSIAKNDNGPINPVDSLALILTCAVWAFYIYLSH